jgi:hypothetical protein
MLRKHDISTIFSVSEYSKSSLQQPSLTDAIAIAVVDVLEVNMGGELVSPGCVVLHNAARRPRAAVQLHPHAHRPRVLAVRQEADLGGHDRRVQVVQLLHVRVLVAGEDLEN